MLLLGCPPGAAPDPTLTRTVAPMDHGDVDADRISVDHAVMGGVPCVAGTRIPVSTVVGLVANGLTVDEILVEFPVLTGDDVRACLAYAAKAVDSRELPLRLPA